MATLDVCSRATPRVLQTGLDSSTTYQIVRSIGNVAHLREATVLMSLLQPPPETFDIFDDIMLLAEGTAANGCHDGASHPGLSTQQYAA